VTVQDNTGVIPRKRSGLWRDVLQPKFQSAADKIDNQRPLIIAVAISAHDRDWRTNRAQLVENSFRAKITKVPDLIRAFRQRFNHRRKFVMCVSKNENFHHAQVVGSRMRRGRR